MKSKQEVRRLQWRLSDATHLEDKVETLLNVLFDILDSMKDNLPCDHNNWVLTRSEESTRRCDYCGEHLLEDE